MREICVLALNNVFDSALVLTRDVLRTGKSMATQDGAPDVDQKLVSVGGHSVSTASGLRVATDGGLSAGDTADLIVVPGYGLEGTDRLETVLAFLRSSEARSVGSWLARCHERGAVVAAGCTATFLLAETGLLDGLQATTSWWLAEAFRARYPAVDLQAHMMLTSHHRVVCAGAAMAHMDLALWILGAAYGPTIANRVARVLLLDERASQARYMVAHHASQTHPDVLRAEAWIRANLANPMKIEEIATAVALSPRTLARRFAQTTGEPPLRFVQRLRVEHAVHLLETSDLPFDEIASRVGYTEPAGLRRIMLRETGRSPSSFRRVV